MRIRRLLRHQLRILLMTRVTRRLHFSKHHSVRTARHVHVQYEPVAAPETSPFNQHIGRQHGTSLTHTLPPHQTPPMRKTATTSPTNHIHFLSAAPPRPPNRRPRQTDARRAQNRRNPQRPPRRLRHVHEHHPEGSRADLPRRRQVPQIGGMLREGE